MIQVIGDTKLAARFKSTALKVSGAVHLGTSQAAEQLLEDTLPYVPVETGELYDSGFVRAVGPGAYSVGFSADHAIHVHERLDLTHAPPTKAKFLESTYLERKDTYAGTIINAARGAIL